MFFDEPECPPPRLVGRLLELLLLAIEEAVRCAFELDELVLDIREPQRALKLEVVLVADGLVGAALEREDRAAHLRHERQRARRAPVEADRAVELVVERRRYPGVRAAEAEADREDRCAIEGEQLPDAGADVRHHLVRREPLDERHVIPVVGPLVDARGAAEVVERDGGMAAFGEAERELLVEAVEAADIRQDHDPGGDGALREGAERGEAVAVLARQDEVVVGDGRAEDARDRRLRVELETHRAGAYETDRRAASYHRARAGRGIAARRDERGDPCSAGTRRSAAVDAAARRRATAAGSPSAAETRLARTALQALIP